MAKKSNGILKIVPHWSLWILYGLGGLIVTIGLLIVVVPSYTSTRGLRTLGDATSYAARIPEGPDYDNTNKVRPDYTTFHRAQLSGYVKRKLHTLASWVGLKREPEWSPAAFTQLVDESLIRFKQHKVRKNIVYKVAPKTGTRFVVWGDVLGAYHSIVRGLQKLKELSIIDDELKIVADDTYLVFMGDLISRSPYGMETLSLVLRLIEINPDRVIYLRGNHEDNKYWHAFGLKDQLMLRLEKELAEKMVKTLDDLFLHLPLGMYLPISGHEGHYVRLSHLGSQRSKKLKEERYGHFLQADQQKSVDRHQIEKSVVHNAKISIDAVIRSEKKRHTFQTNDGVRLLEPDQGATTWTVQSAPTRVQQEGLKFFHDAFVIVTAAAHKSQWALTLYSQDVRDKGGFATRSYQFFTGKQMSLEDISSVPAATVSSPARRISVDPGSNPVQHDVVAPTVAMAHTRLPAEAFLRRTSSAMADAVAKASHPSEGWEPVISRRQLRHRKAIQYIAPPPSPPALPVPARQQNLVVPASTNVIPGSSSSVSITVTPPAAGAADQSTIISVKVPPASAATHTNTDTVVSSGDTIPQVTPVFRSKEALAQQSGSISHTATQLEVLERQSRVNT